MTISVYHSSTIVKVENNPESFQMQKPVLSEQKYLGDLSVMAI